MLRIYGNLSDKHNFICLQRISSEVYLKLGTPPESKSPASKMELKAHVHQKRKPKSQIRSTWTRGPSPRNRGPRWPWSEDKRHLGGPKNLIAVEARGTNNICSHPIYWKEQMSWAKIVIFSKVARGSNTKYAILLFVEYVEVYALFGRTKWTQNLLCLWRCSICLIPENNTCLIDVALADWNFRSHVTTAWRIYRGSYFGKGTQPS